MWVPGYAKRILAAASIVVVCLWIAACATVKNSNQTVPVYTYEIVNMFPHDAEAFTEGLVFENGILYEGTGLYGDSSIRKVDLETGKVLQMVRMPGQYYGEGITIYKDSIIQLTLDSEKGFIYDKNTLELLREFPYAGEGWGITHDEAHLIMSDGTSTLRLLDPVTLKATGQIEVHDPDRPIDMINELEYINGEIYANVWLTNRIAVIDPKDGMVRRWIDLAGLLDRQKYGNTPDVLNGIAYDEKTGRLFVTGKLWPVLFEIKAISKSVNEMGAPLASRAPSKRLCNPLLRNDSIHRPLILLNSGPNILKYPITFVRRG
jgi:glutamine cyclotransferase